MSYSELTRRYFEADCFAGVLSGPRAFRGAAGSRAQGTWVQFDVQADVVAGVGTIQAVRFLAFACPHVIAVAAWVAEQAVGMQPSGQLPQSVRALSERFAVPVEKLGRLLIVEDAWRAAHAARHAARGPPGH